ncbi:NF-kappa-B inhibitor zeta [Betta splendens]|uniref:NF-kappa-B inhibitor zeta n=1 Tax=Betta splendens TaxID=158456 RepID=A0A6P7L3J3_BETSP|nr:NF-kappa-B inhibitor zeta [Betta splendens]XP_055360856.1 NF-kappa-B inhibitor zeta [Betta splendens]XP_055360859.1 NF-kappa-B inhibitor zeta [Betta splendens]
MLDSRWNEALGYNGNNFSQDKGCLIANLRTSGHIQVIQKKNTVKELLMMRRQKCINQHGDNSPEPQCKYAKLEPAYDTSPAPVTPEVVDFPPLTSVPNGHITPPQMQHHQHLQAPAAEIKMTLFQWQVQQEAQKFECVSPEMLQMQDADGDTCLHIAVAQGRRALTYVLAGKMAIYGFLDLKEHNGQTPLQLAVATNQHLIVRDLLEHGAQINTQDLWGRSPLHVCAEKGHFLSLRSICSLIGSEQTIDVEMFNFDGLTPLHVAVLAHNAVIREMRTLENPCAYRLMELTQRKHIYMECIRTLLVMGASYGKPDLKSGRTCLHIASEEANVELFQLFLNQSSSLSIVNVKTFSGNSALHIVSSLQNHKTQVEAVKLLMRKGADPGTRNFENELPSQLVPEGPIGEKIRQILKGKNVHA